MSTQTPECNINENYEKTLPVSIHGGSSSSGQSLDEPLTLMYRDNTNGRTLKSAVITRTM